MATARLSLRHRLEALFWVLLAAFAGFFGDGRDDLLHIVQHDPRINR
jgi:hypothetical protein